MGELTGVDPECRKPPPTGIQGACGIRIVQDKSCYAPVGGIFWNETTYSNDPWESVVYRTWYSFLGGYAYEQSLSVVTGVEASAVNGHAIVVHDATGTRVACGILAPEKDIANAFVPYYNYNGSLHVSGSVRVSAQGVLESATQTLAWTLSGVDADCATTPTGVKNACGVHIHEGMDCTSDAGGHLYNKTGFNQDPWLSVTYESKWWFGVGWLSYALNLGVPVVTGLTNYDVLGHTVIVHDSKGDRIACGILNAAA